MPLRRILPPVVFAVLLAATLQSRPVAAEMMMMSPEAKATLAEVERTFGFVPTFLKSLPDEALPGAWAALRDLELNPNTAIPGKYKSLIGLAVSSQVPCGYCVYFDTQGARAEGASEDELREAIGMAAITRQWSTVLNGRQIDRAAFAADVKGILEHAAASAGKPAPMQEPVTDAASAYRNMQVLLGRVPGFLKAYPEGSIAGAWREFRDLQMNPATAVPNKYKELIGLAVAAQIPCTYCIEAHTEFAKANGATDQEVSEAVAVSALARHWSTYLNGSPQDFAAFKGEVDRIMKGAGASAKK